MPDNGITNAQIYEVLLDTKQSIGRMEAGLLGVNDHVKAVSGKIDRVREELQSHAKDPEAHGIRAEKRGRGAITAAIGAVLGAVIAGITVVKFLGPLAHR